MALFEFELARVEDIVPWGEPGDQSLSWFALTDGRFRVLVGDQVLFQYTEEILCHWKVAMREAEYQVAAFARDILGSVAAGVAKLPEDIERLAANWDLLTQLRKQSDADDSEQADDDLSYNAWRWLGERSPWTSYLVANPSFQFVRIGDELHIHWDNRERLIDGIPVWTAHYGVHVLPVGSFLDECRNFANRLLDTMDDRIDEIETKAVRPQIEVDARSLRQQHATWRDEFASYFNEYKPDLPWSETQSALRALAEKRGVRF